MLTSLPVGGHGESADMRADDQGRVVKRPWGSFEPVIRSDHYQVKLITVHPGAKLSLQSHYHRAEHWVVVSGTAEVILGAEHFFLYENQGVHIPQGAVHRLANPGVIPLQVIEVQIGAYLGENDIVRLEDAYGRTGSSPAIVSAPTVSTERQPAQPSGTWSRHTPPEPS